MTKKEEQNQNLGTAASQFLASLSPEERETSQQAVYRFVRWYGGDRLFSGLTAPEVAKYAEQLSSSDTDYTKKLEIVRAFLAYARKQGWSQTNLATHLKAKKSKNNLPITGRKGLPETVTLTRQGYAKLEAELAELREKRQELTDEIRRAAADKDFRENAPLDAAREQKGHVEGRIMELEETLKAAAILSAEGNSSRKAGIGDSVILCDLASSEEVHYTLVHPREVDPIKGKISDVSPIGKAIIGHGEGDTIEITVPAGKLRYQIKQLRR